MIPSSILKRQHNGCIPRKIICTVTGASCRLPLSYLRDKSDFLSRGLTSIFVTKGDKVCQEGCLSVQRAVRITGLPSTLGGGNTVRVPRRTKSGRLRIFYPSI